MLSKNNLKIQKILLVGLLLISLSMNFVSAELNYSTGEAIYSDFNYSYNSEGVYVNNSCTIIGTINASIDEVEIYNRSFNSTERTARYNKGLFKHQGNYTSGILDAGQIVNWTNINWTFSNKTANQNVSLTVRTGDTYYNVSAGENESGNWSNWTSELLISQGETLDLPINRFLQYKAKLQTNTSETPILTNVKVEYILDEDNPNVTLISPTNNTYSNESSNNFTSNLTDNYGLANATIYIYNSVGSLVNETTIQLANTVQYTWGLVVDLADGVYTWFVKVFDVAGNSDTSENYTLTVDTTAPSISLISPEQGTQDTDGIVRFTFNPTDRNEITNCSLIYQGGIYTTSTNVINGSNNVIEIVGINSQHPLYSDDLRWSISCTDEYGNIGSSVTRNLDTRDDIIDGGGGGGGGGSVLEKNPKSMILTYPTKWRQNKIIDVTITVFDKYNNKYEPNNMFFQYNISGLSLISNVFNEEKYYLATFGVKSDAELGDQTITVFAEDEVSISSTIDFEITKYVMKADEKKIDIPDKVETKDWLKENAFIIGIIALIIIILVIVIIAFA